MNTFDFFPSPSRQPIHLDIRCTIHLSLRLEDFKSPSKKKAPEIFFSLSHDVKLCPPRSDLAAYLWGGGREWIITNEITPKKKSIESTRENIKL